MFNIILSYLVIGVLAIGAALLIPKWGRLSKALQPNVLGFVQAGLLLYAVYCVIQIIVTMAFNPLNSWLPF